MVSILQPFQALRPSQPDKGEGDSQSLVSEHAQEADEDQEGWILCRGCRIPVTRPSERRQVEGAHLHTFANPSGIVFEIGCFSAAPGCQYVGPPSDEFTWFRGYQWRIAVCRGCLNHLGWAFTTVGGDGFHGLIVDRLLEVKSQ
jgi:hypothetical protein